MCLSNNVVCLKILCMHAAYIANWVLVCLQLPDATYIKESSIIYHYHSLEAAVQIE